MLRKVATKLGELGVKRSWSTIYVLLASRMAVTYAWFKSNSANRGISAIVGLFPQKTVDRQRIAQLFRGIVEIIAGNGRSTVHFPDNEMTTPVLWLIDLLQICGVSATYSADVTMAASPGVLSGRIFR